MKKGILLVSAILLLVCVNVAVADDTKVTLSLKVWNNSWEEKVEYNGGGSQTWDMGSATMVGPALNVRFANNMFIGATYLISTKDYESSHWDTPTAPDMMSFDRKDTDITIGYMFIPQFGIFAGYKSIESDMKYTYAAFGINDQKIGTWSLKGPGIGILGNIPVNDSFAFYGSLAIMSMKQKINTDLGSASGDMGGASLEIGAAYAFSQNLSANLGYKTQSFSGDDEAGDTSTDTFSGVTFGLNYTF